MWKRQRAGLAWWPSGSPPCLFFFCINNSFAGIGLASTTKAHLKIAKKQYLRFHDLCAMIRSPHSAVLILCRNARWVKVNDEISVSSDLPLWPAVAAPPIIYNSLFSGHTLTFVASPWIFFILNGRWILTMLPCLAIKVCDHFFTLTYFSSRSTKVRIPFLSESASLTLTRNGKCYRRANK